MYPNLEAEMARKKIRNEAIAKVIDKDVRSVRNKKAGVTEFTFNETVQIRDKFFPGVSLEYLFEQEDSDPQVKGA